MSEKLSYIDATLRQLSAEITRAGYNKRSFAKQAGVTPSQLGDWLNGRYAIPVTRVGEFLEILGVDPGDFGRGVSELMRK